MKKSVFFWGGGGGLGGRRGEGSITYKKHWVCHISPLELTISSLDPNASWHLWHIAPFPYDMLLLQSDKKITNGQLNEQNWHHSDSWHTHTAALYGAPDLHSSSSTGLHMNCGVIHVRFMKDYKPGRRSFLQIHSYPVYLSKLQSHKLDNVYIV